MEVTMRTLRFATLWQIATYISLGGLITFAIFVGLGAITQFFVAVPDWLVSVLLPGLRLFWPHGIHSDQGLLGFAAGGLFSAFYYAILLRLLITLVRKRH